MPVKSAVVNSKGGVGKSTSATNLAAVAATMGRRTLLIDLDPQGTSSWLSGAEYSDPVRTAAAMFQDDPLLPSQLAVPGAFGFDVVPAGPHLAESEHWLATTTLSDYRLSMVLKKINPRWLLMT
ncbi:hypothetical protein CAI21_22405 [Alkalilimnicola ehrlichii]|uniref:AAA domain-containing protein n=1 Tax=Alkalilimnicola ehrlichii TaxID=351052 RepID=A0A3E0WHW4_9GAMM|nr:ParA family protein [Alkalilimnicola ehrlichii]RFA24249.1 hypothetical protein CAI21_22405 [Alkalilimnicola ehrlichii]RFA31556.1 hypothetical protein CAL65_22310 [Alkalilimnicola ehrlichii]